MRIREGKGMSICLRGPDGRIVRDRNIADEIVSISRYVGPTFDIDDAPQTEYHITYITGREIWLRGSDLTPEQRSKIDQFIAKTNRFIHPDPTLIKKKPKRLHCEYCGRIALTDRPTCEGCGAVLPWEIDYEA